MNITELLRDAMADEVGPAPDYPQLARAARRVGGRQRRRRILSGTAAAAVTVALLGAGYADVARHRSQRLHDGATALDAQVGAAESGPTGSSADPSGPEVPITGRATAAGLRDAIRSAVAGQVSDFRGQDPLPGVTSGETWASVTFAPADGTGPGAVEVNVQPGEILDGQSFDCGQSFISGPCRTVTLANGDRLRVYENAEDTVDGRAVRVVAELLTAGRQLRVVASSTNGFDLPGNRWDVTRDSPVLDADALVSIVQQGWWGLSVPRSLLEEGDGLAPYEDVTTSVQASDAQSVDPRKQ
ncbi:MAG: hypothetical protein R2731_18600 [Nocardioides sp.]